MSKVAVIFWSGTGNTEDMANGIVKGVTAAGLEAELFEVAKAPRNLGAYAKIALGCPSMGDEVLEESEFEPYFKAIETQLAGKSPFLVHMAGAMANGCATGWNVPITAARFCWMTVLLRRMRLKGRHVLHTAKNSRLSNPACCETG